MVAHRGTSAKGVVCWNANSENLYLLGTPLNCLFLACGSFSDKIFWISGKKTIISHQCVFVVMNSNNNRPITMTFTFWRPITLWQHWPIRTKTINTIIWRRLFTWLWRRLPLRKRQSPTTVFLKTNPHLDDHAKQINKAQVYTLPSPTTTPAGIPSALTSKSNVMTSMEIVEERAKFCRVPVRNPWGKKNPDIQNTCGMNEEGSIWRRASDLLQHDNNQLMGISDHADLWVIKIRKARDPLST